MFRNYLKIAFRTLGRNKIYSFINIAGLAAGMAVALLIGLWIRDELNFNRSIANYERVGQVWQFVKFDAEKTSFDVLPLPLAAELRQHYPEIKRVSLSANRSAVLKTGDKKLAPTGLYVEPSFSGIMALRMKSGAGEALTNPRSILLSATLSKALFADGTAVNQFISFNDASTVKVEGVFEDFPENSSFREVQFLAPWALFEATESWVKDSRDRWDDNNFNMYVQLNDQADFKSVSAKIKDVRMRRADPPAYHPEFFVHPMSRWHLYGDFKNGVNSGGLITYVWLFGCVAIFVLLLACINYMNLSTARSEKRAREVGIRKTIGSSRLQIITQFFSESLVYVFLAFALSIILALLCLPFFNDLSGKHMRILWTNPWFWIIGFGFSVLTATVAGSYPSLYLSRFIPVKVLKGTFKAGRLSALPRKALVVLQFTVSVSMIIGTIVVFRQVQFVKDRPAGYSRQGLLEVKLTSKALVQHFDALATELENTGAVLHSATSSCPITSQYGGTTNISWRGKTPDQHPLVMGNSVSQNFGKTIGWKLRRGRDFSRNFQSDSGSMVLNEAAVALMGFKDPIGETVTTRGKPYKVIGVVKDMIRESPFQRINPTFYVMEANSASVINIRITKAARLSEALTKIASVFEKYDPATPFNYQFVDDLYERKFSTQERVGKLAGFFALLAIFISCLGLFGLASYVAEQRTKEIGIRKTLGASMVNIWKLISGEFIVLVGISLLVATPLAYLAMAKWLMDYEYRTSLSWHIFVLVGAAAILITLLTVSFQAIRAALANPVRSLRSE